MAEDRDARAADEQEPACAGARQSPCFQRCSLCVPLDLLRCCAALLKLSCSADQAHVPAQAMQGFLSQLKPKEKARVEAVLTGQPAS